MLALGTAGAQLMAAVRAEVEATLDEAPALWAGAAHRLPQNKVENDAQSIRYQNGHERPDDETESIFLGEFFQRIARMLSGFANVPLKIERTCLSCGGNL